MTKGNEPASPIIESSDHNIYTQSVGLTKREEFALTVIGAFMSNEYVIKNWGRENIAREAVEMADLLITALNEKQDGE